MHGLKQNEYIVLFESKGLLYVEYNDTVLKFQNPFEDVPNSVSLVKVDNELYIKGFEPKSKAESSKKESKKKKKDK